MALTTINSGGVKDDSIVNADIKSDAAIAGSKINPAFTTAASITAAQPQLQFQDSDGTNQITEVSNSSGHTYIKTRNNTGGGNFYVNTWDNTNSNYPTLFTILNGGNCGIGTTSPTDLLNLEFNSDNSTVAEGLFLNNTAANTGDNVSISFSTDSGNRKKSAISHVDEGPYGRGSLTFSIDGADTGSLDIVADEKFRINYDGKVGIGTTSPIVALDVNGEIALPHNNTIRWHDGGSTRCDMYGDSSNNLIIRNNSGNAISTLSSAGNLTLAGDLVLASTKGINFEASPDIATGETTSSQTLDDYEEGSFTPNWRGNTTAGDATYNTNVGRYTKIGDLVHCNGYSVITGNGGTAPAGNSFFMGNLPFVSSATTAAPYETGSCMLKNCAFATNGEYAVTYKPAANDDMQIYFTRNNDEWLALSCDTDMVFNIIWSISYKVT